MLVKDFVKKQRPSEWLVDGLMPAGHTVLIAGMPGAGKSFFVEGLAISVASGMPYLGLSVIQGPALLFDEDVPSDELGRRLIDLSNGLHTDLSNIPLYIYSHEGFRLDDDESVARIE